MTLPGRKRTANDRPARQVRPRSISAATATAGAAKQKRKPPNRTLKSSLLQVILADTSLDAEAAKRIVSVHTNGLSLEDLAGFVAYQIELARHAVETNQLDSERFMVAMTKIGSQVAAAAQLGGPNTSGAKIAISFSGTGKTSQRPEVAAQSSQTDADVGDIIETE